MICLKVVTILISASLISTLELPCPDGLKYPLNSPNLDDPCSFYQCYEGVNRLILCPKGFGFDVKTNTCQKSEECQSDATADSNSTKICKGSHQLVSNPRDCTTFYSCASGHPVLISCPDSLLFNQEKQQCDWPEEANCCENGC